MAVTPQDVREDADPDLPLGAACDEQLMEAISRGSADAFGELFSRYKQPLFGFFRRRVEDPVHAEELTQESFLAIVRVSSRYEAKSLFRTYLYAIALKILGGYRRKAAFRAMFMGAQSSDQEPATRNTLDPDLWLRSPMPLG